MIFQIRQCNEVENHDSFITVKNKFMRMKIYLQYLLILVAISPFYSSAQTVTGTSNSTYKAGDPAIFLSPAANITTGAVPMDAGFMQFSISGAVSSDIFKVKDGNGITFVNNAVYYNGTIIGSIDAVNNGTNGKPFRVNFLSNFENPSFENGLTGFTQLNQRINLGTDKINGWPTPAYTRGAPVPDNDDNAPISSNFLITTESSDKTEGTVSLRLNSSMTTAKGFDVVHGPAVYSATFEASAGDKIYLDWKAEYVNDDYDVVGYILNVETGAITKVIESNGQIANWSTASATIPVNGKYSFVFVAGTFDASGGRAAGASLYIDNIKVFGNKVNNTVASALIKQITYESNCITAGVKTVTVDISNQAGATATASFTVTASDPFPVAVAKNITITLNSAGTATILPADVNNNSTDNCAITNLSLDVSNFTRADVGYPKTVTLTVSDGSSQTATKTAVVTVRDAKPAAPVFAGYFNGYVTTNKPIVSGNATPNSTVTVYLDGAVTGTATASANGNWTYTLPTLTEASHSVYIKTTINGAEAADPSDASSAIVDIQKPATPAAPTLVGSTNNHTKSQTPTISGTTSEPFGLIAIYSGGAWIGEVSADAAGNWTYTFPATLPEGDYNLNVTSQDKAGNTSLSSAIRTITVDITAPGAPVITTLANATNGNYVKNNKPTISGTAEANATVTIYNGAVAAGTTTADATGKWSYTFTTALADGTISITADAMDLANNRGAASPAFSIIVDTTVPVAPVFTLNNAINTNRSKTNKPTISGTAEANSTVTVYLNGVAVGTTTAAANGSWSYTFTTALNEGNSNITATATDVSTNVSPVSAVLAIIVDTTAPVAPIVSTLVNATNVNYINNNKPTVSGTAEANSTVTVYADGVSAGTATADATGKWSFTFATALANGSRNITATATDATTNVSPASTALAIIVDTTAPAAPVVSTLVDATNTNYINKRRPTVTGTAEAGSTVSIYANGVFAGTTTAAANGTWSYNFVTELTDGNKNITATATDAATNVSSLSSALAIIVDTTPPAAPVVSTLLNATNTNRSKTNKPTISGTAEANSTVTVYLNGIAAGTATAAANGSWSYTFTAALNEGNSNITATSTDAATNVSAVSAVFAIIVDTTAPVAPTVSTLVNATNVNYINNNKPTVTGTAEANSTVTVYADGGSAGTTTADATGKWSFTFTTALADGNRNITATATDATTNVSPLSTALAIIVDIVAPAKPALPTVADLDNGVSYTNRPLLSGQTEANATVEIFIDNVVVAKVTANSTGNWSYQVNPSITEGNHAIKVKVSDLATNSSESNVLNINVSSINKAPTLDAIANRPICYTPVAQQISLSGITPGRETDQTTSVYVTYDTPNMFDLISVSKTTGTNGVLNYKLSPGVSGEAKITVYVKDNGGTALGGTDTFSRTFTLTVNALPVIAISSDKGTTVSKGEALMLTATGGVGYSWANANGILNGQNTATLSIRPSATTTYTVTVTNASGCSEVKSITIVVNEDYAKIKATNILTPNGDGVNDKWIIDNIDFYTNNEVKIFDRAGRLLYSKKQYDNSWDGTLNGAPLNEGTYYYVIDFGNKTRNVKGFITIVRENQ